MQALTTLNEPIFLECARALALRTLRDGGCADSDRLAYAFRRCLSRPPTIAETSTLGDAMEARIAPADEDLRTRLDAVERSSERREEARQVVPSSPHWDHDGEHGPSVGGPS